MRFSKRPQVSVFAGMQTPAAAIGFRQPSAGGAQSAPAPQYRESPTWPSMSPLGASACFLSSRTPATRDDLHFIKLHGSIATTRQVSRSFQHD